MARRICRLSARSAATLKAPGLHADGAGLYLRVDKAGAKRWTFLFRWHGRRKELGLGSALTISLAEARERAAQARETIRAGDSPIERRRRERASQGLHSFGALADQLLKDLSPQWKSAVHRAQWKSSLEVDAAALRPRPVSEITTEDVLGVLKPVWPVKPETASRLRGRIERVLDAAKAKGLRTGENPARWRGHLSMLLPKRAALERGHHAAMPFGEIARLIRDLRCSAAIGSRALEFTILTAKRTGEVIGARSDEFDLDAGLWIIPAWRMKDKREHREPLSPRAAEIVRALWPAVACGYIFRSRGKNKPISNMAMAAALAGHGGEAFTVHGFRSSFQDWAEETTTFPESVVEMALAHAIRNKTRRAYRRGDALDKRRKLMNAWARYCEHGQPEKVAAVIGLGSL